MRTRILWALLGLTILFAITWYFYSEVIVDYFWFIKTQLKTLAVLIFRAISETWIVTARVIMEIWLPSAKTYLVGASPAFWIGTKAFFTRQISRIVFIESWKKPLMAVLTPIGLVVLGSTNRRKIREITASIKERIASKKEKFSSLPRWQQVFIFVSTVTTIIALSFVAWWFGIALYFVSAPAWMVAKLLKLLTSIWLIIQRLLFQGVFFKFTKKVHLFVITKLFPKEFEKRLQLMLIRSVRAAARKRKMTVAQLEEKGLTFGLWWSIRKERLKRTSQLFKKQKTT